MVDETVNPSMLTFADTVIADPLLLIIEVYSGPFFDFIFNDAFIEIDS